MTKSHRKRSNRNLNSKKHQHIYLMKGCDKSGCHKKNCRIQSHYKKHRGGTNFFNVGTETNTNTNTNNNNSNAYPQQEPVGSGNQLHYINTSTYMGGKKSQRHKKKHHGGNHHGSSHHGSSHHGSIHYRGGNHQSLSGSPWTPNMNSWPGVNGTNGSGNHYALNTYNDAVALQMKTESPINGGKRRRNRTKKYRKRGGGGFFINSPLQDVANVGSYGYNQLANTYNAYNGTPQIVSPSVVANQLPHHSNLNSAALKSLYTY